MSDNRADGRFERFLAIGRAAVAAGRFEEAGRLLEDAVALRPDDATAHVELAGALRGLGRVTMARHAYARALAADPGCAAAAEGLHSLRPDPQLRGNFEVGQRLGSHRHIGDWTVLDVRQGGFGVVYIVRSSDSGKRMALKTFDTRLLWSDEDRARFEREALTWVRLEPHRHVANAEGVEWIEGLPCVVTDYAEGGDLAGLLRAGPLPPERALRFARHLCDGLRHAHEQLGLVHRDVKPANCLLTKDGTLQVTDFGLARAFESDSDDLVGLPGAARPLYSTAAGTPSYMPPEQFVSGIPLDTRADVYAFGVVFFQMLTGTLPSGLGKARAHVDSSTRRRARRTQLVRLIRSCTEPDRKNRPSDFAAVRELLDGVYREVTGGPAPPPPRQARVSAEDWVSKSLALHHLSRFDEALEAVRHGLDSADQNGDGDVTRSKLWQVRGMVLEGMARYDDALAAHDRAVGLNRAEPSAWLCRGTTLRAMGRNEEALECFERTLELQPADGMAWGNKATVLRDWERYDEADEAYARGFELRPRDERILVSRAVMRWRQNRNADALSDLDRALAVAPRDFPALYYKGCVLLDLSRPAEAMQVLERAAEIKEDYRDLWWNLMRAAYDLERYEEALAHCEKVRRMGDETADRLVYEGLIVGRLRGFGAEALAAFERAIVLAPKSALAWVNKADAPAQLGRHDEALAAYDRAVELNPRPSAGWSKKALALRRLDRQEEALAWLERAVEAVPGSAVVWGQRGAVLFKLGRLTEALPCYERWRELDPTDPKAWLDVGYVLGALDRHDEELACYQEAVELWPDEARLWNDMAVALRERDRFEEAEKAYARAVQLSPGNENTLLGRALLRRRQGRDDDTLSDLDRALAAAPRYVPAMFEKGCALLDLSRPAEALEVLERAIEIAPEDPDLWWNVMRASFDLQNYERADEAWETARRLGDETAVLWIYKGLIVSRLRGFGDEALACHDRAIALSPKSAVAWINKGDVLNDLDRDDEALPCFDRAIELDPDLTGAWTRKAYTLLRLDRHEEALACCEHALGSWPDNPHLWQNKGVALEGLGRATEAGVAFDNARRHN